MKTPLALALVALLPLSACGGSDDRATSLLRKGMAGEALAARARDPCTLVSATEAQPLRLPATIMGVLVKGAPGLDSMTNMVMKHQAGCQGRGARPKPVAHPAHACDLLPQAAVEAAIGPLSAPPRSDSPESDCTWQTASPQGTRTYAVEFDWDGGQKNYAMLTHGMATLGGMTGLPSSSLLDTMNLPPQATEMMGGLMKMVAGNDPGAGAGSAPGAVTTVGFNTDTTLKGPWDHAALLHGTQLFAVRHDAFVGMSPRRRITRRQRRCWPQSAPGCERTT